MCVIKVCKPEPMFLIGYSFNQLLRFIKYLRLINLIVCFNVYDLMLTGESKRGENICIILNCIENDKDFR